ncbi:MAG: leucine-rich repeat domain-containing protein [Verrucomicrobia bacterium]|nr:leucine-rich repeat domain-containing protein [Verrucomicrobiota bacterium]
MSTSATQTALFFFLPPEKQVEIFDVVLSSDGNLGSRLVCRDWLKPINESVRKRWQYLKQHPPVGPLHTQFAIARAENQFRIDGQLPEGFNYLELFRSLNREWKNREVVVRNGELQLACAHYSSLQAALHSKLVDFSLMEMWKRVWPSLSPFACDFQTPQMVREWIQSPDTEAIRESVIFMDLSDLGIRYIPIELTYFPNVQRLRLQKNHIDSLPPFLGQLKAIRFLNLSDNDLQELPDDFPTWTHLGSVDLTENPLNEKGKAQIAQWKSNVERLQNVNDQMHD